VNYSTAAKIDDETDGRKAAIFLACMNTSYTKHLSTKNIILILCELWHCTDSMVSRQHTSLHGWLVWHDASCLPATSKVGFTDMHRVSSMTPAPMCV